MSEKTDGRWLRLKYFVHILCHSAARARRLELPQHREGGRAFKGVLPAHY